MIFGVFIIILMFVFARTASASSKTEIKKINRHLASTPMRGTGKIIYNQSKKYGINPYFIIAVAHKESSLGIEACGEFNRNVWGLGACGRAWNVPSFHNWVQAINYFVRFIDRLWPNADSPYEFYGYCNGCEQEWGSSVADYMYYLNGNARVR